MVEMIVLALAFEKKSNVVDTIIIIDSVIIITMPWVASKGVHKREKHVLVGCKHDMFWHQSFKVWSRRLLLT